MFRFRTGRPAWVPGSPPLRARSGSPAGQPSHTMSFDNAPTTNRATQNQGENPARAWRLLQPRSGKSRPHPMPRQPLAPAVTQVDGSLTFVSLLCACRRLSILSDLVYHGGLAYTPKQASCCDSTDARTTQFRLTYGSANDCRLLYEAEFKSGEWGSWYVVRRF